jgi:hypothetical protein
MLASCNFVSLRSDRDTASEIAEPAKLAEKLRPSGKFVLTVRERITRTDDEVTIYIEGDGMAWLSRNQPSPDPTPDDPIALRLAALDASANVAWIARPCQYTPKEMNPECRVFYWTSGRFSEPVIDATDKAVSAIKEAAGAAQVHLVGFSGGGGIAVLVAARRKDVASLRTIAGNIDHRAFTSHHKVSPMEGSLNPADAAEHVRTIPQIHFVGADDKVIPSVVAKSFLQRLGATHCATMKIIPEATHSQGWALNWTSIAKERPRCSS